MDTMSFVLNTMVARNAGVTAGGDQVRFGLLGSLIGGAVGVVLTKRMADQSVASSAQASPASPGTPAPTPPVTPSGPVLLPPPVLVTPPTPVATAAQVPDVRGQKLDAANRQLYDLGFKVGAITANDAREQGTVLDQDIIGKTVPKGSLITLTVSLGPKPVDEDEEAEEAKEIELMEEISKQLKSAEGRDIKVIDALTTLTQAVNDLKGSLGGAGAVIPKK